MQPGLLVLLSLLALTLFQQRAWAQPQIQAFTGARILPISGPALERGVLLVEKGKILRIGDSSLPIPDGAVVTDCTGKTILPGLVDTHSHITGAAGGDASAPLQPDVRVYDSLNIRDSDVKRALSGGITTVNIMPGSGHLLSGQTVYLKLRGGRTVEDFFIRDASGNPTGGLKMANGTKSCLTDVL